MALGDVNSVVAILDKYIKENRRNFEGQVTPDTRLLSLGVIDSLAFLSFISHLEKETGLSLDLSDFEIADFETPTSLHAALQDLSNA